MDCQMSLKKIKTLCKVIHYQSLPNFVNNISKNWYANVKYENRWCHIIWKSRIYVAPTNGYSHWFHCSASWILVKTRLFLHQVLQLIHDFIGWLQYFTTNKFLPWQTLPDELRLLAESKDVGHCCGGHEGKLWCDPLQFEVPHDALPWQLWQLLWGRGSSQGRHEKRFDSCWFWKAKAIEPPGNICYTCF